MMIRMVIIMMLMIYIYIKIKISQICGTDPSPGLYALGQARLCHVMMKITVTMITITMMIITITQTTTKK